MRTVWRYEIDLVVDASPVMLVPSGPVVHVAARRPGVVELWVQVDPREPPAAREFVVVGTGHPAPDGFARHVGTALDRDLVWHLYELP